MIMTRIRNKERNEPNKKGIQMSGRVYITSRYKKYKETIIGDNKNQRKILNTYNVRRMLLSFPESICVQDFFTEST